MGVLIVSFMLGASAKAPFENKPDHHTIAPLRVGIADVSPHNAPVSDDLTRLLCAGVTQPVAETLRPVNRKLRSCET